MEFITIIVVAIAGLIGYYFLATKQADSMTQIDGPVFSTSDNTISDFPSGNWLVDLIKKRTIDCGVDPSLIYGIIMTESSGNPSAQNPTDPSSGLMGITPFIGRAYAGIGGNDQEILQALLNPELNSLAGCRFLAHLAIKYGYAWERWIDAYNLGETKYDKGIRMPSYVQKVIANSKGWTS